MTREASAFLAAVKWDEEAFEPRDFIRIHSLPQVAKNIALKCRGAKKLNEECTVPLNQPILWLNVTRSTRIIAQPVKFRNSLPPVPCGSKVSLDHNFPGWFEILSEDGCTSKCMESVAEVAKRKPEKFLIRQKIKGNLASNPETSVLLQIGEILTFVSSERIPGSNHSFLRCITQSGNYGNNKEGSPVLLPLETKGKFSQVAGPENISGVHSLLNLIRGKRMPIMVRLVISPSAKTSLSREFKDLRLEQLVHEDFLMGINLMKETDKVIRLPLHSQTRLIPPANSFFLTSLPEYRTLVHRYIRSPSSSDSGHSSPSWPSRWDRNLNLINEKLTNYQRLNDENQCPDSDYDDIDQLYDYVRGLAPLPSKKKVTKVTCPKPLPSPPRTWNKKEESIYESLKRKPKDTCKNVGGHRMYVKSPTAVSPNNKTCGNCLIRKNSDGTRTRSSLSSPLFAIRYKSLTELPQVSCNPVGDPSSGHLTLESNYSGRKTSSSSKDPFKDPKAKNRKLSKQLSLSNLFRLTRLESDHLTIRSESPVKSRLVQADQSLKQSQSRKSLGTLYM